MAAVFSRSSSFLPGFMRQPLAFRFFSTSSSSILNLRVTQLEDSPYVDSRIVDLMYDQSVTFLETLEQKARQELATLRRQLEDIHLTREVREKLTEQERKVAFMILTEYHAKSAYSFHVKKEDIKIPMFQEMSNDEWISLGGGGQALTRRLLKKFHFIRDGILSKDTEPHINLIVDYESAEGATSPYIDGSHLPMTTARLVNRGNILLPDVSVHSPKVYFSLGSYHLIPSGPYSSLVQPPKYLPFLSLLFIDCDVPHLESGTIRQKLLWAKCDIESRSDKFENSKIPLKGRQHEGAFQLQAEENDPVKYEQPKPQRGTDWHRCLYVLINHENSLNLLLPESSNSNFDLQKILGQNKGAQVIATQWFLTTWTKKVTELYRNENDKEIGFGNIVQMRS